MVSSLYFRYYIKSTLRSWAFWWWSIIFIMFWLILGALEAKPGNLTQLEAKVSYAGSWYATLVLVGLGSAAVSLSYEFIYASIPARYLGKYSRLTPTRLYLSLLGGFTVISIMISVIILVILYPVYSWRLESDVPPHNLLGVVAISIVTGVMLYVLSATGIYASLAIRKAKAAYYVSYLPLLLALGLGVASVTTNFGWGVVISPFNAAETLLFSYYSGIKPRLASLIGMAMSSPSSHPISPLLLWLSLIVWIAGLSIAAVLLLRIQKGIGAEELRLI